MAEIKTGLRGLLAYPRLYDLVQRLFGDASWLFDRINARSGDRILDIGCGTASILTALPANIEYIGYEPNARYVETARAAFGHRATFYSKTFEAEDASLLDPFDLVLVIGVLHHMDDDECLELFRLMYKVLKSGGRIITLDPVFVPTQNPIARLLISLDRGRNVRPPEAYRTLASSAFASVYTEIKQQTFLPYTYFVMSARKP